MMLNIEELKKHSYDVIGAIHAVHKELGPGLYESIYQEGLKIELFNYMRLCQASVGILVNFYPSFAEIERYFFDKDKQEIYGADGMPIKDFNKIMI